MDDEERRNLAEKLDKDLESFIASKVEECKTKVNGQGSQREQTLDELVAELKQHPAFMTDYDETQPMSAAMEGLQALKYESDSTDDNAVSFKEDGNKNFEMKKYRWAIDNYTAGIKCLPKDKMLNAVLYTNRAAANYHLGNFRSAFYDCVMARKFKPDHMKAVLRGVLCSIERKNYDTAITWSDEGLEICPGDKKLLELRTKANQLLKKQEKEKRKEQLEQKKELVKEKMEGKLEKLMNAIQLRKITICKGTESKTSGGFSDLTLESLESCHPSRAMVTLDDEGILHWPVIFLYPEFGETDFITSFCENSRFVDQLEAMFDPNADPPGWDPERRYTTHSIEVYFEDRENEKLHRVKKTSTLLSVLQDQRFVVMGGTPNFILFVKDSNCAREYLAKYSS